MADSPLLLRGIERIIIVLVAALFAYLGFRLFALGHTSGPGKLQAKTKIGELILSGTGPGLFFMAFGGLVLIAAVFHGEAKFSDKTTTTTIEANAPELAAPVTSATVREVSSVAPIVAAPPVQKEEILITQDPSASQRPPQTNGSAKKVERVVEAVAKK